VGKVAKSGGHSFSSAHPKNAKNRAGNHANNHSQEPVTGSLTLKGFPTLRAKTTVKIMGVGEEASGTYYVKKCTHTWRIGQGYQTKAELSRAGTGKGGVGDSPPNVMYANIWKQGDFYLGPRKQDDEAQVTFTYGEGRHLIDFTFHVKPQQQKHGGEGKSEGRGIDLEKKAKAFAKQNTENLDGGGDSGGQ
jgi:hypothetical protein